MIPTGLTDEDLLRLYPFINWREPIKVKLSSGNEGWSCRLCIAHYGLKDDDENAIGDLQAFDMHLANFHDLDPE